MKFKDCVDMLSNPDNWTYELKYVHRTRLIAGFVLGFMAGFVIGFLLSW